MPKAQVGEHHGQGIDFIRWNRTIGRKERKLVVLLLLFVKDLDGLSPGRPLAVVDLAQVQHLPLQRQAAASDSVPPSTALGASRLPSAMKASSNWKFRRLSITSHTAYWPLQTVWAFDTSLPVRRALPFLPFRASVPIEWTDCMYLLCPLLTSAVRSANLAIHPVTSP